MKANIDALFDDAKSSEVALKILTDELMSYGKSVTKSIINRYSIYNITIDEVEDYILSIVNDVIRNYHKNNLTFKEYVVFVMYKRLTSKLIELCNNKWSQVISLDENFDDDTPLYDVIEDKTCGSIPESISYNEFQLKMSSPHAKDDPLESRKKKVYTLEQQGYSGIEIMALLHISEGQFRYIQSLIKEDLELMKKKMALK